MRKTYQILTYLIASVWIANGLFCKILDLVPRHQLIVARILHVDARMLTIQIGIAETLMALWILSGINSRLSASVQIVAIATMNLLEFFLAPDLLLWGKFNAVFALLFIVTIFYNEFYLNRDQSQLTPFAFLKDHPFAVEAFFESSLVITFAIPKNELQKFIPPCLELDTFNDKWAFLAVAMVQTKQLRPKGFPAFAGNDFFLAGYRVFVRYKDNRGKSLRGLYILKSETDKKKMQWMGNTFTHYNYSTIDITQVNTGDVRAISSKKAGFAIRIDTSDVTVALPVNSPFANWHEARRFAGPLPFTFTYEPLNKQVLIIEGVRQHWQPRPVSVLEQDFAFLQRAGLGNAVLANAFIVENIPYYWKKAKKEIWNKQEDHSRAF